MLVNDAAGVASVVVGDDDDDAMREAAGATTKAWLTVTIKATMTIVSLFIFKLEIDVCICNKHTHTNENEMGLVSYKVWMHVIFGVNRHSVKPRRNIQFSNEKFLLIRMESIIHI